jgi:hypothetical protein
MTSARTPGGSTCRVAILFLPLLLLAGGGCRKKASPAQCAEVLDRFAMLVVREQLPNAGPEVLEAERVRERGEAKNDDAFKNCPSEVQASEHACAMGADSSEALLKCLE